MNIFFFDKDPIVSAQTLCDKHVVKMTTETVQIISTVYYLLTETIGVYKPTHKHHPCVIWASKSLDNIKWLCKYANALGDEYTKRYNKKHKAIFKLQEWLHNVSFDNLIFKDDFWSNPPQCMPDQYRQESTIDAYKAYYLGEKMGFAVWKYTDKPDWCKFN